MLRSVVRVLHALRGTDQHTIHWGKEVCFQLFALFILFTVAAGMSGFPLVTPSYPGASWSLQNLKPPKTLSDINLSFLHFWNQVFCLNNKNKKARYTSFHLPNYLWILNYLATVNPVSNYLTENSGADQYNTVMLLNDSSSSHQLIMFFVVNVYFLLMWCSACVKSL